MATLPQRIEARVIQKIATEAEWNEITLVPYKGEVCLVGDSGGKVVNIKIGDGINTFPNLDYMFDSIQQNVGYIAIESNALPTPLDDVAWGMVTGGTYTFGGSDVFTVPDGHWGIANYSSGAWSLVDMGELPGDPTEQEWDTDTSLPLSGSAIGKGISKYFSGGDNNLGSAEDVKDLNIRLAFFDRPDLPFYYPILTGNNRVIDRVLSENHDGGRMLPIGTSVYYIDRPDLSSVLLVDKDGKLIGSSSNGGITPVPPPVNVQSNFAPWNPPVQQPFSIPDTGDTNQPLGNYNMLIGLYDDIMSGANINPNFGTYVSKESVGVTNVGSFDVYKYSFKPAQPKAKVLLIGGSHANEKMYIECLHLFAKHLCENWSDNEFLSFLRWNVQVDVLPCRSPYTLANDLPQWGSGQRMIPETPLIPASWTRVGNTITMTFEPEDFPVNDGFLSASNYFTSVASSALIDKMSFYVPISSDGNALPFGQYTGVYRIASVVNSRTITFNTNGSTGATSGTCEFQFWTDPNKNPGIAGTTNWEDYRTPNSVAFGVGDFYNKGTRPWSLVENRILRDLIVSENYDLVIDGHCDAADNDMRYDATNGYTPDIDRILSEAGAFNSSTSNIINETGLIAPYMTRAITRLTGISFLTIEWGSGLRSATGVQVQDALIWMGIVLKNNVVKIINNKNT